MLQVVLDPSFLTKESIVATLPSLAFLVSPPVNLLQVPLPLIKVALYYFQKVWVNLYFLRGKVATVVCLKVRLVRIPQTPLLNSVQPFLASPVYLVPALRVVLACWLLVLTWQGLVLLLTCLPNLQ